MYKALIYFLGMAVFLSACKVGRYLPAGERLYSGADITIVKEDGVKESAESLKDQLKLAIRPASVKFVRGRPYKVWWWYAIGQPKRPKGIRAFFRNKLGEPPILSSKVNAAVTAINMQAFLENLGYFHSTVTGDTVNSGYMTTAVYKAHIFPRYTLKNISWLGDSSALINLLQDEQGRGILKTGNGYHLSDIQAERERLDLFIKTRGYFYFKPEYISYYADSTIGNNEVNLYLFIKKEIPENARHPFTINRITVFPNYTLLLPPPDTSQVGTFNSNGLLFRDTVHKFHASLFRTLVTYRPGDVYNSKDQNITLNRLINLGTFKFVKNRFEQTRDSADPYRLNVFYYLTPAKKKSLQAEVDGFSKENKFLGAQASLNWRNRNAFKGAQLLMVKLYAGLEKSFADSLHDFNNYRLGMEASINLPRVYMPFIRVTEDNLYPPRTRLLLGYEYFRKEFFYTKNTYRLQYEFAWKEGSNKEHNLSPFTFTYIHAGNITDVFSKETVLRPALLTNAYSEIILGSFYSYTFNTANPFAKRQWFFRTSLDVAGNLIGALSGADAPRQKGIFNIPFAQYAKMDVDLRYQRRLPNNFDWVNRLLIGIGLPYGNSALMPFSKQYVIGGGASLRGFPMRQMGPGSYIPTLKDQKFFQVIGGDYKLQVNSEMRIPIFAKVSGAAFVDLGNIWTKDTITFGKAGQLKKDFYKEIAVDAGLGVRFDAGLILLRVDVGLPLRKPYLPEGQRWVINQIAPGNKEWRQKNLIINLALGFPF